MTGNSAVVLADLAQDINLHETSKQPSPVPFRTMMRSAALASMVEASTPMRTPWTKPTSAISARTQSNTAVCTPSGFRAFDSAGRHAFPTLFFMPRPACEKDPPVSL